MMHSQIQALANDAIKSGIPADEAAVGVFLKERLHNSATASDIRRFALDVLGEMSARDGQRTGSYEEGCAHA